MIHQTNTCKKQNTQTDVIYTLTRFRLHSNFINTTAAAAHVIVITIMMWKNQK